MNTQKLKEQLTQAMELKEYAKIEDIWLNLIELSPEDLASFYSMADWLAKNKEKERAATLLLFLIEHFKGKGDFQKVLDILKKAAFFNPQDKTIRQELINCYQVLLSGHPQKEELIEVSGIKEGVGLLEILPIFDQYLKFNIGEYFYRPEWGVGKIIGSDLIREKRCVIDFQQKKRHGMSLDAISDVLTRLDPHHFLVIKATDIASLKNMPPIELIVFLLKSINQPLTPQKIKTYLQDIVSEEQWLLWWNKVGVEMTKDKRIKISGINPKTYLWCKEEEASIAIKFDKAKSYEKMELAKEACEKGLEVSNKFLMSLIELAHQSIVSDPALAIEIFLSLQELKDEDFTKECEAIIKSCEDFSSLLQKIQGPKYQLQTLKMIKTVLAEKWQEIYLSLFFSISTTKLLEGIINEFWTSGEQEKIDTILGKSMEYPERFFLICKMALRDGIKLNLSEYELLSGLLKILKENEIKELQDQIKAFLLKDGLLKEHLDPWKLNAFCDAFLQTGGLKLSERNKLKALLTKKDVKVVKSKEEEAKHIHFYALQENIYAKRQELADIMTRQIPENIKEIALARSYGDLRENFEYKAAKERQKLLYAKLVKLRAQLARTKVIRPEDVTIERVNIGTRVKLVSVDDKTQIKEYAILGPWESDPDKGIISYLTAIGNSLLKKKIGDRMVIEGREMEIVEIAKGISPLQLPYDAD
jgi:transcription elongation GreA/GreB family factor